MISLLEKKIKLDIIQLCSSKGCSDSCLLDSFLSKLEDHISFDQGDVFFIPCTFLKRCWVFLNTALISVVVSISWAMEVIIKRRGLRSG